MSASPPPTPPSRAPQDSDRRFKHINSPCEWVEDYHPSGLHPVDLGDVFKDGQYRVIRKLGEGAFSNVWLARDLKHNRYTVLKILVAAVDVPANEAHILHFLSTIPDVDQYITKLLDEFDHEGPNGTHKCLVFEPMGPSVNSMVEGLPQFQLQTRYTKVRYPPPMARSILKQALLGLRLLHEHGVAHGDFQPGNMLFGLGHDFDSTDEDVVRQQKRDYDAYSDDLEEKYDCVKVERLDGKQDRWAPQYLYMAQSLMPFTPYTEGLKIKLSDMGGAYFFSDPPEKVVTPAGLRAPELLLTGAIHPSLDIWSFGCLLFELVTGRALFSVPWYPNRSDEDDDHLCQLTYRIGPLPHHLYRHWKTSSLYFTPERRVYNLRPGGPAKGQELKSEKVLIKQHKCIEGLFDETAPDVSAEEGRMIKALVRRILQYDPEKRPSAADILQDPWFAE